MQDIGKGRAVQDCHPQATGVANPGSWILAPTESASRPVAP
jgi:hypothetical protein